MRNPNQHRMCTICRQRDKMTKLIRLQSISGELWPTQFLGHKLYHPQPAKKRSIWVCPTQNCVVKLTTQKKRKRQQHSISNVQNITMHLKAQLPYLCKMHLKKAYQSGQLLTQEQSDEDYFQIDTQLLKSVLPKPLLERINTDQYTPYEVILRQGKWSKEAFKTLAILEWLTPNINETLAPSRLVILKRVPKSRAIG